MSEAEVKLWSRLRRLRERGFHIRRQAPFRGYYLDFVCFSRRLVIEVDGGQHTEDAQAAHDAVRDRVLEGHGFRVMRIWTSSVHGEIDDVMDSIVLALEAAALAPPVSGLARSTLPMKGEGKMIIGMAFSLPPCGEGGSRGARDGWGSGLGPTPLALRVALPTRGRDR